MEGQSIRRAGMHNAQEHGSKSMYSTVLGARLIVEVLEISLKKSMENRNANIY